MRLVEIPFQVLNSIHLAKVKKLLMGCTLQKRCSLGCLPKVFFALDVWFVRQKLGLE